MKIFYFDEITSHQVFPYDSKGRADGYINCTTLLQISASGSSFKPQSRFPVLVRRTVQVKTILARSSQDVNPKK